MGWRNTWRLPKLQAPHPWNWNPGDEVSLLPGLSTVELPSVVIADFVVVVGFVLAVTDTASKFYKWLIQRLWLVDGTVLSNKKHLDSTVVSNKKHLDGTVPLNKKHLDGTAPSNKKHLDGTLPILKNKEHISTVLKGSVCYYKDC